MRISMQQMSFAPALLSIVLVGCGQESSTDARVEPSVQSASPVKRTLNSTEARQLADDTLQYFHRYQRALADDAVMDKDALLRVFNGAEFSALSQRWPQPFTGDVEVDKFGACQNLLVSASGYAHAKHDYAFNGLPEKEVLPLRRQFRQDMNDCRASLAK
ncbi:hypothetical protein [Burkholderia cepacia]|uniref:hypothetical protein n=1 Tax=Burkholderia cepacia TaxID=292 RepID=UPI0018C4A527|nr:hypothetical protein [Burkholderia cepacia]